MVVSYSDGCIGAQGGLCCHTAKGGTADFRSRSLAGRVQPQYAVVRFALNDLASSGGRVRCVEYV